MSVTTASRLASWLCAAANERQSNPPAGAEGCAAPTTCRMRVKSVAASQGFVTKKSAPAAEHAATTLLLLNPESTMMLGLHPVSGILRKTSSPSSVGSTSSRSTTSGRSSAIFVRASAPSAAVPTISMSFSAAATRSSILQKSRFASAVKMRVLVSIILILPICYTRSLLYLKSSFHRLVALNLP